MDIPRLAHAPSHENCSHSSPSPLLTLIMQGAQGEPGTSPTLCSFANTHFPKDTTKFSRQTAPHALCRGIGRRVKYRAGEPVGGCSHRQGAWLTESHGPWACWWNPIPTFPVLCWDSLLFFEIPPRAGLHGASSGDQEGAAVSTQAPGGGQGRQPMSSRNKLPGRALAWSQNPQARWAPQGGLFHSTAPWGWGSGGQAGKLN